MQIGQVKRGTSPLRGAGLSCCASSSGHSVHVSPLDGLLSLTRLAAALRARWRAGCRRTAVRLAGALANAAIKAAPSSRSRTAESGRRCRKSHHSGPFPYPWIAGWRRFLHDSRERDSLDELAGVPLTPLRFVRCGSTQVVHQPSAVLGHGRRASPDSTCCRALKLASASWPCLRRFSAHDCAMTRPPSMPPPSGCHRLRRCHVGRPARAAAGCS